jgi:hypothetical protein
LFSSLPLYWYRLSLAVASSIQGPERLRPKG